MVFCRLSPPRMWELHLFQIIHSAHDNVFQPLIIILMDSLQDTKSLIINCPNGSSCLYPAGFLHYFTQQREHLKSLWNDFRTSLIKSSAS